MAPPRALHSPPFCQRSTSSPYCRSQRSGAFDPSPHMLTMAPSLPLELPTNQSSKSVQTGFSLSQTGCYATAFTLTPTKRNSLHSNPVVPTLNVLEPSSHRLTCGFLAAGFSRFIDRHWYGTLASSSTTNSTGNPMSKSWQPVRSPPFGDSSLAIQSVELTSTTGTLSSMPSHSQSSYTVSPCGPTVHQNP